MAPHPLPQVGIPSGGYSGRSASEAAAAASATRLRRCPRCGGELLPEEKLTDSVGAVHSVRGCLVCRSLWTHL